MRSPTRSSTSATRSPPLLTSQSSQCLAGSYLTSRDTDTSREHSSEGSIGEKRLSCRALRSGRGRRRRFASARRDPTSPVSHLPEGRDRDSAGEAAPSARATFPWSPRHGQTDSETCRHLLHGAFAPINNEPTTRQPLYRAAGNPAAGSIDGTLSARAARLDKPEETATGGAHLL